MDEAAWLLQMLPELLQSRGAGGVRAFLDLAKAYATVDRPFLMDIMDIKGGGRGLGLPRPAQASVQRCRYA